MDSLLMSSWALCLLLEYQRGGVYKYGTTFSEWGMAIRMFKTALLLLSGWSLTSLLVSASPLVDFQVTQPLTLPSDAKQCTVKILE